MSCSCPAHCATRADGPVGEQNHRGRALRDEQCLASIIKPFRPAPACIRPPRHFHTFQNQIKAPVKKTYQLNIEGKNRDRLLDAAKHDIRKYIKRERNKALPKGVDFWDFDCKLGASEATAAVVPFAELIPLVDALVKEGAAQFYVEIVAKGGVKITRVQDGSAEGFADVNKAKLAIGD